MSLDFVFGSEPPVAGRTCLAPPARHLVVVGEREFVTSGPHERRSRVAIDPETAEVIAREAIDGS